MPFAAGDTFILTHATGPTPHLWVILWGPEGSADAFLMVSLSTLKAHSDGTVRITVGEHPFIQHDTCAVYSDLRKTTAAKLAQAEADRQLARRDRASSQLLEKLRRGVFASPRTPNAMGEMARNLFGAQEPED
jgi:hypothetical protein